MARFHRVKSPAVKGMAAFLTARYGEEQTAARTAMAAEAGATERTGDAAELDRLSLHWQESVWPPEKALADLLAKQGAVETLMMPSTPEEVTRSVLSCLVLPYHAHPDFKEQWRA